MAAAPLSALPPRTFAELNQKWYFLPTPPVDLDAITVAELWAGIDVTCRLASDGTTFRATDSDTIADGAICEPAGAEVAGASKYEATAAIYRFFSEDTPGTADPEGDALFAALRVKGSPGTFVIRHVNKRWDEPWAAGDEYSAFVVTSDNWQHMEDPKDGYIKATVPLLVSDAELNGVVAGATVPDA